MLQCFVALSIVVKIDVLLSPPPLHLQAQFPLHEPLVDANGTKTQSQRPVTFTAPSKGVSHSTSRPLLRRQRQLALATNEPVPGASAAGPTMVIAAGAWGEGAVDKGREPAGPSLSDLAIGPPVPFPPVQTHHAGDVRTGFLGLSIALVNKQPAPAYLLNHTVNVKRAPRLSTERWYWSVTLDTCTAPQQRTSTRMHLLCRVAVRDECGLVAGEGGFFVGRFA